jgi:hypothetical protein
MGQFLHKYNTDNVHTRAIIVGLVNLLNSKVVYDNVLSDENIDTITVPFFYSMTGDERFLQDFYLEWNDCIHPKIADGNYDVIPRGIVQLSSNTINTAAMTHRFVRGNYVKEINGQLQTFNSFINSIPLTMSFDVTVKTDTNIDAFKIQQSIIETFYKTQVYSVSYKGFRVPCQVGFPEDYGIERTFEFSYADDTKINIKFTLAVETYLPVIDPTTTRNQWNRITTEGGPGYSLSMIPDKDIYSFTFSQPTSNATYFSGNRMQISWSTTGTIMRTNIYYRLAGTNDEWQMIARSTENSGDFYWNVPFFDASGKIVTTDPVRATVVSSTGKGAKIRAIINASGEVEKIIIFDAGYGYSNEDTIDVSPLIQPPPGVPPFVSPTISAGIQDGRIISVNIHNPGSGFIPTPTTAIELKIEDAVNPDVFEIYKKVQKFTGDTDTNLVTKYKITNLNPSVAEMISFGITINGAYIDGVAAQVGSKIVSVDVINNLITLDKEVSSTVSEGDYALSPSIAIFDIQ